MTQRSLTLLGFWALLFFLLVKWKNPYTDNVSVIGGKCPHEAEFSVTVCQTRNGRVSLYLALINRDRMTKTNSSSGPPPPFALDRLAYDVHISVSMY